MISAEWLGRGYAVATVFSVVGVAESSYYYHKSQKDNTAVNNNSLGRPISGYSLNSSDTSVSDEQIKKWLMELVLGEEPIYGYRKLTKCLLI